jgi:RNA polymerase sigma-70 factor (ECF subfamily)
MNDFADQLAQLRPTLVRIARNRLRNDAWADDAVSETLLAALEQRATFDGRALRPWLLGILRHKLTDQVRRHTRERQTFDGGDDAAGEIDIDDLAGLAHGVLESPAEWADPQERLARRQLAAQIDTCLQALPPKQGRAFVLCNWIGEENEIICGELGVTANHLKVLLHRARVQLRAALLAQWALASGGAHRHAH